MKHQSQDHSEEGECKSCTGILIYSEAMKSHQKPPVCLG